jgi:hypothetical protein
MINLCSGSQVLATWHLLDERLNYAIVRFCLSLSLYIKLRLIELHLQVSVLQRICNCILQSCRLKYPQRGSCSERTDNAFVMLISIC